jgi:hypothetical protein
MRDEMCADEIQLIQLSPDNVKNWSIGEADTVILQMSGYGFAMRGAPLWLLREISMRRKQIKVFGVYFHELYALGSPSSSSFWLSPVQRYISRKLVETCDFWLTNRDGSDLWLRKYGREKPHTVLPVISNIGEAKAYTETRLSNIVVFGSPGLRAATYKAVGDRLFNWARHERIQIHDIGEAIKEACLLQSLRANGVIQHGFLDSAEIHLLVKDAFCGLLSYPAEYLAKSSVFAAYCAHGICPVLFSREYPVADRLVAGTHYLTEIPIANDQAAKIIGRAAFSWYQAHNLQKHRECLMSMIQQADKK